MNTSAQFAADIAAYRLREVTAAVDEAVDAGHPADVVAAAAYEAGRQWDDTHPTLASRLPDRVAS